MAASEAAPFAKTGGLADVLGSLPHALHALGHDVAVTLPRYNSIPLHNATRVIENLALPLGICDIYRQDLNGVAFFFVECPALYDRPGIYSDRGHDFPDNHLRFAFFCQAVLAIVRHLFQADVLHLHDWQTALCAPYIRTRFSLDPVFVNLKIVFTIHNLEHQGRFGPEVFPLLGLDSSLFEPRFLEFYGDVNFMKGGIVFSDAITTVSPKYAEEIQTPEFGFFLDGLLRAHASRLTGIINGVDYNEWNPETDRHLAAPYSPAHLEGKFLCKIDLLHELNLPADNLQRPVLGMVSRFARQKGFDLFMDIAWEVMNDDVCLIVLGSGEERYEEFFRNLASTFPGRVASHIGYNNRLAHKIEAGADIFLMPSVFEPCGLNQIYSLRYGTVPVVRATGGLENTVDAETGFKFRGYWPHDLLLAIRSALDEYRGNPEAWTRRMKAGMSRDFSWTASAKAYINLSLSL
jgi:starch synthase